MASVAQQDCPKSVYEIVVDNGSTDRTPEIARHFQQITSVRYVLENRIGLCVARNTGWQSAAGRYISFFDRRVRVAFSHSGRFRAGAEVGRRDRVGASSHLAGYPSAVASPSHSRLSIGDRRKRSLKTSDVSGSSAPIWRSRKPFSSRSVDFIPGATCRQQPALEWRCFPSEGRRGYECLYVPSIVIEHLVPPSRLN